jgi:hypothetical protein
MFRDGVLIDPWTHAPNKAYIGNSIVSVVSPFSVCSCPTGACYRKARELRFKFSNADIIFLVDSTRKASLLAIWLGQYIMSI